jgi:hypothetical protein
MTDSSGLLELLPERLLALLVLLSLAAGILPPLAG